MALTAVDPCGRRALRGIRRLRLRLITNHPSLGAASDTDALPLGNPYPHLLYGVGRGCGVGRSLGVALGVAVGVGVGVTAGVGVGVTVGVGGVTVGVGVGVG